MIITSLERNIVALMTALVLIVLGNCSLGVCDDGKNAAATTEPIPVKEVEDDYRIWLTNDITKMYIRAVLEIEEKGNSSSDRALLAKLPQPQEFQAIISAENETSSDLMWSLDPKSGEHHRWFELWLRDEVKLAADQPTWPIPEDALIAINGIVATLLSNELLRYFQRYQEALNNIPDEVTWKKNFKKDLDQFIFVWHLEKMTFALYQMEYDKDNYIGKFQNTLSIESLELFAKVFTGMFVFDKTYDIVHKLPKSRFTRLFVRQLKVLKEMVEDPKVKEWAKRNKDELIVVGGKSMTVEDVFLLFTKILQQYDSGSKKTNGSDKPASDSADLHDEFDSDESRP